MDLEASYRLRYENALSPLSSELETHLRDNLQHELHIDRISARPKSVERFLAKAKKDEGGGVKYPEPMNQIQDQIGARIVVFYLADVIRISAKIDRYYRPIEARDLIPESEMEFGYFGRHYVLLLPTDLPSIGKTEADLVPDFFELQIKTLFQHAWSEANHDLGYKPGAEPLTSDDKRVLAFTAAQAWGADRMFDDLFRAREGKTA